MPFLVGLKQTVEWYLARYKAAGNLIEVCRDLRMRDLTAVKLKIQHNSTSEVRQPVKPHFSS